MTAKSRRHLLTIVAAIAIVASSCGSDGDSAETTAAPATEAPATAPAETTPAETSPPVTEAPATFEGELVGVFEITEGACDGATVSGSYFRMIQTGGTAEGPFVPNADSPCVADQSYSLLAPGTDGGLASGTHQPAPDPAFDAVGNATAAAIAQPAVFFGVAFAVATDEAADAPALSAAGGVLSGQVAAFTAYYGGAPFNQGSPKPDGSKPGLTADVVGTIDPVTGAFVLEWSSQIVGGPFDSFTGVWHFEGTFVPA
ncbi:MAG: hypothetical protein HY826_07360 [Actinobacteria bacterium]|nr:hypothetical protein [Actinomycetota bacterium]